MADRAQKDATCCGVRRLDVLEVAGRVSYPGWIKLVTQSLIFDIEFWEVAAMHAGIRDST